ncbi:hypothetical protein BOTBODRAFT_272860 [Botryobasidium botryosum FD-172 SS1]|uniref:Uncharacterized protein n=1 Tax=Botryobasidium botryosum (strain FD-172 SS1) TaxID=930990 RepID=A0A067MJ58_BOTB1|nr:hypothetical protein BOTBODRAFT_272860 [Botryobasidium botryosum FD-172 SS1]
MCRSRFATAQCMWYWVYYLASPMVYTQLLTSLVSSVRENAGSWRPLNTSDIVTLRAILRYWNLQ